MKTFLVTLVLIVNSGLLFGQQTRIELGDKYFDQFAYNKAIEFYEGIDDNKKTWDIYANLGDCYYYTSRPKEAAKYYRRALGKKSSNMDHYRLKYTLSMLSIDDCKNVIKKLYDLDDFKTLNVIATYFKIDLYLKDLKELKKLGVNYIQLQICQRNENPESEIMVDHLDSINTKYSDFGGYIHNNTFYFASSRENPDKNRRLNKRLYNWNTQPFLDIYEAIILEDSIKLIPSESSKMDSIINTIAHEAGVAITNDGKTMYYSGGEVKEYNKNKLKYNKRWISNLKLKRAKLVNNKWIPDPDKNNLDAINLENYSVGNPTLSPDNKWLLFVTCAPYLEAKGQTDIYYVKIEKNIDEKNDTIITYGTPKNLSQHINTSGRESFPFISKDSTLYFSSDGVYNKELGLGLLDIYKVYDIIKLIEQRELGNDKVDSVKVVHLEAPFNSEMDDFAYFVRPLPDSSDYTEQGYFSSNRNTLIHMGDTINSKGDDDIYRFHLKRKCKQTIQGSITDLKTEDYLEDATVNLIDSTGMVKKTVQIDSTGVFSFDVECDQFYRLTGSMARYYNNFKEFNSAEVRDGINLKLKPFPCEITVHHVYKYDTIEGDRIHEKDLLPVLDLLIANPDIKIRIESHTDSRGSHKYNLDLSELRAQSSKSYLIRAGIKESQITSAKGFGKNCLLIGEEEINNSLQTEREAKHALNRRSRFIIEDCKEISEVCQDDPEE